MKNKFINVLKKQLDDNVSHQFDIAFVELSKTDVHKSITYGEFYKKVCKLGEQLIQNGYQNMKVILYMSNNIDSIINLFSCFYANIMPIIKSYNTGNIEIDKYVDEINVLLNNFNKINYVFLDNILYEKVKNKLNIDNVINLNNICPNDLIFECNVKNDNFDFVLSTSGSTAIPKCVKINIDKMFSNILFDNNLWKVNKNSKFLNWLPISHIYGLTSIVFIPLYFGATSYLMKPHDYYDNCYLWIESISKYRITHTSIINFALNQLSLIDNIDDNIDLSSLQNLSIGGESVKLNSVRTFYNKYKKYNLKFNVFSPSYGMSENSGLVSEYKSDFGQPLSIKVDRKLLIEGKMKEDKDGIEIVNLGQIDKSNVLISSKNGDYYNNDDEIGEVVLNDKSLCSGYLNNNQEFPKYFHTGDLGFIHNDCLYLCGRIKDVIVIRGKNFASSLICDTISNTLSKSNVGINTFITLPDNDDSIYFVQEVLKPLNTQALKLEIQEVIKSYTKYDIPLENIILIKSSDLPKLSSGKLDKITLTNLIMGGVLK